MPNTTAPGNFCNAQPSGANGVIHSKIRNCAQGHRPAYCDANRRYDPP